MMDVESAVAAQIVDAARRHFLRFGYSRVSTEEIARSIGRSKKTLYKHFETKEALLHAVLARLDSEAGREIAGLLADRGGDRLARLRAILTAVAEHTANAHQVLLADLRACSPELGLLAWRRRREALGQLLIPVLREAAEEHAFRADLAPDRVLAIFFACVEGLATPPDDGESTEVPGGRFGLLVGLLVDGLRAR